MGNMVCKTGNNMDSTELDEDLRPVSTTEDEEIGLEMSEGKEPPFPRKWVAVLIGSGYCDGLASRFIDCFQRRGFGDIANGIEFGGSKMVHMTMDDFYSPTTDALFYQYGQLGVDLAVFFTNFQNVKAGHRMNFIELQNGMACKHIHLSSEYYITNPMIFDLATMILAEGPNTNNGENTNNQGLKVVQPSRVIDRTFPHKWVSIVLDECVSEEQASVIIDGLADRGLVNTDYRFGMSYGTLTSGDIVDAYFHAIRCCGMDFAMFFVDSEHSSIHGRIKALERATGIITQIVLKESVMCCVDGNQTVIYSLDDDIREKGDKLDRRFLAPSTDRSFLPADYRI